MKRIFFALFVLFFVTASIASAAGTVVETQSLTGKFYTTTLTCVGDAANGTIPDTTFKSTTKKYIQDNGLVPYRLIIENVAADTNVTNDSDVYLVDSDAAAGAPAAGSDHFVQLGIDKLDDSTRNVIRLTSQDAMAGDWKLRVINQATNSGQYTVKIIWVPLSGN